MHINSHYIDTHCHLFLKDSGFMFEPTRVVKDSFKAGIEEIWLSATNLWDTQKNLSLVRKYPHTLKTFIGYHPENYLEYSKEGLEKILNSTLSLSFIIGVGEIGIDLHGDKYLPLSTQQTIFEDQVKLALKYKLPIAVHSRSAYEPTLEVLERYRSLKFIWHSCTLSSIATERVLKSFPNVYFGFNSIITYKSGDYVRSSVRIVPNNKIVLETDAPYLTPRPFKYKYNTPEGVIKVYDEVCGIKNLALVDLKDIIQKNCSSYKDTSC